MSFFSTRPFTALALLAMSTAVLAAPAPPAPGPLGGLLDTLAPRWSANKDYTTSDDAVTTPFSKRDGHGPLRHSDCIVKDQSPHSWRHGEHEYEPECLFALVLSIEVEKREICRKVDGTRGYEKECLFELVFKLDIEIDVEEEKRRHPEDWDMRRSHPTCKSDCDSRHFGGEEVCPFWSKGHHGEEYEDDCLFRLFVLLDIEKKEKCRKEDFFEFECMLELSIELEIDLDLDLGRHGLGELFGLLKVLHHLL